MADTKVEKAALTLLDEALEQPSGSRAAWLAGRSDVPAAVIARVHDLLAADARAEAALQTGGAAMAAAPAPMPDRIGAYRITGLIGQGGMGSVYRGERALGDFEHEAAIKVVRPGPMSAALAGRFRQERQILARLDHPGIARLFDGGETEAGEPWFVMEYVEGRTLKAILDGREAGLDALLDIFGQVCRAVRHAHARLIVHGDISPANILVKPDGEAKLIDFGISRVSQADEAAAGVAAGDHKTVYTRAYAAPERRAGQPASVAADIYALGMVLADIAGAGGGDAELRAVIACATAGDPDARYNSVEALIADLDRRTAGFPVAAMAGGRRYRMRKLIGRHRLLFGAIATGIVGLLIALAVVTTLYRQAEAARAAEAARFAEVRALAGRLMFDVYDAVSDLPGATAAREMLAATAQGYLDALAADPRAPFDVRLEAGRGYKRLADVVGGPGGGSLGRRAQAAENYARADAILSALHAEHPDSEPVALALADLYHMLSIVSLHTDGDMKTGVGRARTVARILNRDCADADACQKLRIQGMLAEGENLHWLEQPSQALAAFDRALAALAALSAATRASEEGVRLAARARRLKGDTLYYSDADASATELGIASRLLREAMARDIGGARMERDLVIVEWSRGGSLDEAGRPAEGAEALDRALALMQAQVAADPQDKGSLRMLTVVGGQRALTLSKLGRFSEAIAGAHASLAIRRRLAAEQPDQVEFARDVAIQLHALGDIHQRAGNRREACRYYRETVARFDEVDRRGGMTDFDRHDTYARAETALAGC